MYLHFSIINNFYFTNILFNLFEILISSLMWDDFFREFSGSSLKTLQRTLQRIVCTKHKAHKYSELL